MRETCLEQLSIVGLIKKKGEAREEYTFRILQVSRTQALEI